MIYDKIYAAAEPYWQTRQGDIHMPMAYGFARQLTAHYPESDEAVVWPAILLHDVGWMLVPPELQMQALVGSLTQDKRRDMARRHEMEGVRIAAEILASLNYDAQKIIEIKQIIGGHDTRQEAMSLNDALVKDADKLWRYAPDSVTICARWNQLAMKPYLDFVESRIESWLFTGKAQEMARDLLAQSRRILVNSNQ